ncbi:MAG: hypothetical protein GKR89_15740 [Candidatus Latescibacteria bacterium]|nr:hypothetical protein [Candidatus Latescibacterota bacterium]
MNQSFFNKGSTSNLISFSLLVLGLAAQPRGWGGWVLAAGLFGFAGGVTNWLAVKMLFDRVPLLYGSGVIPARFREIRQTVKELIMAHFFAADYLERFFAEGLSDLAATGDLQTKLVELLDSDETDQIITRKLEELQETPAGMMLKIVGTEKIKPLVRQFVREVGVELAPRLSAELVGSGMDVGALRDQVDRLLTAKLEELDPAAVKEMMEEVIRQHLGWLIVWGNVFGGAIGLVSRALGY